MNTVKVTLNVAFEYEVENADSLDDAVLLAISNFEAMKYKDTATIKNVSWLDKNITSSSTLREE